jgi:hypothetical protein
MHEIRHNCEFTCEWALQRERFSKSQTAYRDSDVAERTNATRQVQRWVIPLAAFHCLPHASAGYVLCFGGAS